MRSASFLLPFRLSASDKFARCNFSSHVNVRLLLVFVHHQIQKALQKTEERKHQTVKTWVTKLCWQRKSVRNWQKSDNENMLGLRDNSGKWGPLTGWEKITSEPHHKTPPADLILTFFHHPEQRRMKCHPYVSKFLLSRPRLDWNICSSEDLHRRIRCNFCAVFSRTGTEI